MYKILFTNKAKKDLQLLKESGLAKKTKEILKAMQKNPYTPHPPYEKLVGKYEDFYSRRINKQHRIVYTIDEEKQEIRIARMWTHYEHIWLK